ncbi:MAG: hypothetical protein Q9221_005274, partial [Calogaya cf. arnoldii]
MVGLMTEMALQDIRTDRREEEEREDKGEKNKRQKKKKKKKKRGRQDLRRPVVITRQAQQNYENNS